MRVLIDENLPQRLRFHFPGHDVATVRYMGWGSTKNGKLLDLAEGEFDVLLTADQRLTFQQNLRNRTLAVIVLIGPDIQIETMLLLIPQVLTALDTIKSGDVVYIGK